MKVVVVEDEWESCEHLTSLLLEIDSSINIVKTISSVKNAIQYFKVNLEVDLIFMDIHLADGISFEIFDEVEVNTPIIFTTAYDQYTLQAFKLNSIDYILKPLIKEELIQAISKHKLLSQNKIKNNESSIGEMIMGIFNEKKSYKSTFLVPYKDALYPISSSDFAGFYIEDGLVKGLTFSAKSYVINSSIEQLEDEVDPQFFYRINRQFMINRGAIVKIDYFFNGKLKVKTEPSFIKELIVSKAKIKEFKEWISC